MCTGELHELARSCNKRALLRRCGNGHASSSSELEESLEEELAKVLRVRIGEQIADQLDFRRREFNASLRRVPCLCVDGSPLLRALFVFLLRFFARPQSR